MKFEKVSYEQYSKDKDNSTLIEEWNNIKLPKRATVGSAGYDIFSPFYFELKAGETIKFPTGIKVKLDDGYFLAIFPRSSLGFKYRLQLDNSVGIIDEDFYNNVTDEGDIHIKITNDSRDGKDIKINTGDAIAQGIFLQYGLTENDNTDNIRVGGIGSTSK